MSMRSLRLARQATLLFGTAILVSCGREPTAPGGPGAIAFDGERANVTNTGIVISQVYGGGGNAGAPLNADFVELFNRSSSPVSVGGWRLHYGSSAGTTWTNTTSIPAGAVIQPGKYYLISLAGGANGAALPAPDATGGINMSGTAGKVVLTTTAISLAGACPTDAVIADQVNYGGSNCGAPWGNVNGASNTAAVLRNAAGCVNSGNVTADFTAGAPAPRNGSTAANPCQPKVTVSPLTATINAGAQQQFSASEVDGGGVPMSATLTWSSSNTGVATVDANGLATGLLAGTATITATANDGVAGSATITVNAGGVASVAVSPATPSITGTATQQFTATAFDAGGNPVTTTFTWSSSDPTTASISAAGLATGTLNGGTTTITAMASNGTTGSATLTVAPAPSYSGQVVISQVYGGGGNGGATFTHDFIELFNRSTSPVTITGWSVQYASATGSFNQAIALNGTLQPGQYYLVQGATGGAVGSALPAFDASGSINLSGSAGKVLLVQQAAPLGVVCPAGVVVVDQASYGSGTNCGTTTSNLSNTTASQRKNAGCRYTGDTNADFVVGAPNPRNSTTAAHSCVAGPLDHVAITGNLSVFVGATSQLNAEGLDANDNTVAGGTTTWTTSDAAVATVSATGVVTAVSSTGSPATITATMTANGVTKSASVELAVTNPGGINWIEIVFVRSSSMPPGFETEMAVRARESNGGTIIPATFTYEAVDAANIAAVPIPGTNSSALLTALAAPADGSKPRVKVTATPVAGGASYSFTLRPITVEVPLAASPSIYGFNDVFGRPSAAGTNANDFLIQRDQFVLSYNQSRGTPNWVAYELDARHMSGADRCNCFTADPLLPNAAKIYLYDYTNGGYDRGHMARSFDRTAGNVDNAITFYMTNMVPQFSELNSGPWGQFENMLGDSARLGGRAVHIVTGPLYTSPLQFVNNAGKVAIPDFTWKVALIGPRNAGIPFSQVSDWSEIPGLTVLAVKMPNVKTVVADPLTYLTTVEALEQETGYDLFSLLQTGFQNALEYKDRAPTAAFSLSGTPNEGNSLTFDASASTDPDLGRTDLGGRTEGLTYTWTFGDGTSATGRVVNKTFANNGNYSVTLTVNDVFGWPATSTSSVAVANVAPAVSATVTTPTIIRGETISGAGSFSDPGADSWSATVDYGDGSGAQPLALSSMSFSLSHAYATAGSFTVTVTVNDGAATTTITRSVTVITAAAGLDQAAGLVNSLVSSGAISNGNGNSLTSKIDNAAKSLAKGNTTPALNQLNALLNEIDAMEGSGRLTPADAAALRSLIVRIRTSIGGS
jgi:DNA/RNA endonuclease G (NUC1)